MIPWLSIVFEAGMATLMVALIVYCVKLNRRLVVLRSQDAEINQLIAGLRDASERAEQSVQRLKAAGLSAERSLRTAIEDATAAQSRLARTAAGRRQAEQPGPEAAATGSPTGATVETGAAPQPRRARRDMLMGQSAPSPASTTAGGLAQERPRTREEAEETLLQAIRTARGGA